MDLRTSRGAAVAVALGIGALVAAGVAFAEDDPMPTGKISAGTRAAYTRHEHFQAFGKAFGAIAGELNKPTSDMAVIKTNVAKMHDMANDLPTWFPKGSGVEARPKSLAKAEVWTDTAGFEAAASNLQVQVSKLNQAATSGELSAVKAQFRPTAGACAACHNKYRVQPPKT